MNKYICWYAYQGMETEGKLNLEEPFKCKADNKGEAIWKYLCWIAMREQRKPYHKNLTEHMSTEYSGGGWGFCAMQLHDSEDALDDSGYFYEYYTKNGFDK